MKRGLFTLLLVSLTISLCSQNPISIDRIINDLNWENCTESDVIFAFKDNIEKREKDETWPEGNVSSFILKNVKIGESISDANIIVKWRTRRLVKIGGIHIKNIDWNKNVDDISRELEDYFSSFWGKEHKKTVDYETGFFDDPNTYSTIKCEWGDTFNNEKSSKGSFLLVQRAKLIVVSIEPK